MEQRTQEVLDQLAVAAYSLQCKCIKSDDPGQFKDALSARACGS